MLVLSRVAQQGIVIGGEITVRIIEVRGNVVRLGIEAPKDITIHRSEIYAKIHGKDQTCAA
jgi:carbon storage regulator